MKKIRILYMALLIAFVSVAMFKSIKSDNIIEASNSTTYTFSWNSDYDVVRTQDAYLPYKTITTLKYGDSFITLNTPSDLYLTEEEGVEYLYIADTGNKRIIKYSLATSEVVLIISTYINENGNEVSLVTPKGVFVSSNNNIYISDTNAKRVIKYDINGNYIKSFTKPNNVVFQSAYEIYASNATGEVLSEEEWKLANPNSSKSALSFEPEKVAVDEADNLYIVLNGVTDGIAKIDDTGDFIGFFTTNYVTLSLMQRIENLLYSEKDKKAGIISARIALPYSNVLYNDGWLYTTTVTPQGAEYRVETLAKHSSSGNNVFSDTFVFSARYNDVFVDKHGMIYCSDSYGYVDVYTRDGEVVFWFGVSSQEDVLGFFGTISGVAVDSSGTVWALDQSKNYIQGFKETDYTTKIYSAIDLYNNSKYEEAVEVWKEVLERNQVSVLAHNGIAKCYLLLAAKDSNYYKLAAKHFELAGNRTSYSEAFWEIRNLWIQNYLVLMIFIILGVSIILLVVVKTNKKYHYLDPVTSRIKKFFKIRKINDCFYGLTVMKHPINSMYFIKKKEKGSYFGATVTLLLGFGAYLYYTAGKGFIFQLVKAQNMDLFSIVAGFFLIIFAFVLTNWLATSIKDGEGTFGETYKGICYSLWPLIISAVVTTILTYVATNNEAFLVNLVWTIGLSYTLILIFISIEEMQNYTIRETIKSILISVVFIAIMAIIFAFVQMIAGELINFVINIFKEAIRNVFH